MDLAAEMWARGYLDQNLRTKLLISLKINILTNERLAGSDLVPLIILHLVKLQTVLVKYPSSFRILSNVVQSFIRL